MIDYGQKARTIINSITTFSFEFDFDTVKKEMELQEVSKEELDKLGEEEVRKKFNTGIFKIKLPNGILYDVNSIAKHSAENNIKEPVIFINPNFKYVQWVIKKDLSTLQIKRHIKNQLTNNTELNLIELQKALVIADTKNKEADGYLDELPIITSNLISEGKFQIQSSCTTESAIKMVYGVIEEVTKEKEAYVKGKIKRDHRNIAIYLIFVLFVSLIWILNEQYPALPAWLSSTIGLTLFLIPLVVMRLINHSIFETLFFRKKVEKKYEKEFSNKVI